MATPEYSYERVVAVAHWGVDNGRLFDAKEVLHFFEKPWHYPEVFEGFDADPGNSTN